MQVDIVVDNLLLISVYLFTGSWVAHIDDNVDKSTVVYFTTKFSMLFKVVFVVLVLQC